MQWRWWRCVCNDDGQSSKYHLPSHTPILEKTLDFRNPQFAFDQSDICPLFDRVIYKFRAMSRNRYCTKGVGEEGWSWTESIMACFLNQQMFSSGGVCLLNSWIWGGVVENIVSGEESNLKTLPVGGNIVQIPAPKTCQHFTVIAVNCGYQGQQFILSLNQKFPIVRNVSNFSSQKIRE